MKQVDIDIKSVQDKIEQNTKSKAFQTIYPFTTENCASYIKNLQVNNCSVLTVGSSADQAFRAKIEGANDITIYDICPFTKYYFYLKKAALLELSKEEYAQLLYTQPLKRSLFQKVVPTLYQENKDSYHFFQTLLQNYTEDKVANTLFTKDKLSLTTIRYINAYLNSENDYLLVREKIKSLHPTFITGDILQANRYLQQQQYDRIILSNISQYLEYFYPTNSNYHQLFFEAFQNLETHLSEEGSMQLAYLYSFSKKDLFEDDPFLAIQNIRKLYFTFLPYSLTIEWIPSVHPHEKNKDAVITYTKHRK